MDKILKLVGQRFAFDLQIHSFKKIIKQFSFNQVGYSIIHSIFLN